MKGQYTAIITRDEDWWIGRIEEVPGVVSQGETREELIENLQSALEEMLEMKRADAVAEMVDAQYEEVRMFA